MNRLILFFIFYLPILFASSQESEILCLSYPRSGTHWTLYCMSYLFEKNLTFNRGALEVYPLKKSLDHFENGFIYGAHSPKDLWIKNDANNNDILILILRN